jgi:2-dehydropantoate 2-reductase
MKFVMMGSGGVGGYFGARLAAAGEEVGFVARGAHLDAMVKNGLKVQSGLGDVCIDIGQGAQANPDPAALGVPDVVFICVKLDDTQGACDLIGPIVGPDTLVISLQNGVEAEAILIDAFGAERVGGGISYIAASVPAPGRIAHGGTMARIQLGELSGGTSPRIDACAAAFARAGVDVEASPDVILAMWQKFTFLVGLSATTTLTGLGIGAIRSDPDRRAFLGAVIGEAVAVARARGIDLSEDYADDRMAFTDTLPEDMTSSMYHDFCADRPLEVGWLSGAVSRMGVELGVETPVNATVYAALKHRVKSRA